MFGSECDLKMRVQYLGHTAKIGAQETTGYLRRFSATAQLNGNCNAGYLQKKTWEWVEGSPTSLQKFHELRYTHGLKQYRRRFYHPWLIQHSALLLRCQASLRARSSANKTQPNSGRKLH